MGFSAAVLCGLVLFCSWSRESDAFQVGHFGIRLKEPLLRSNLKFSRGRQSISMDAERPQLASEIKEIQPNPQSSKKWSLSGLDCNCEPQSAISTSESSLAMEPDYPELDVATKALNTVLVTVLKGAIDAFYQGGRSGFQRFYVLETVARVPYFAYMSVLHLYETLGLHRKANWIKVHYAEADNELYHLLIMEHLGGADQFIDRLLAKHAALAYYWIVVAWYMVNPRGAYHLSQLIEDHACKTYTAFLQENEAALRAAPAPAIAKQYYMGTDMYMFDTFHTAIPQPPRRPQVDTLYDVFDAIREDENQHRSSLKQLVDLGRICARGCTPSPACAVHSDQCEAPATARGDGTSYSSPASRRAVTSPAA